MTATHEPFAVFASDTWRITASLHDDDGHPLDLTGAGIEWTLRDGAGVVRATLAVGAGITITNAVGGLCEIVLPPDRTNLPVGSYYDQVRVILPEGGEASTQAVGRIDVRPVGVSPAPAPTADLLGDLASLKAARRAGVREVAIGNRRVTYASDRELAAAIAATQAEVDQAQGKRSSRIFVIRSNKGW